MVGENTNRSPLLPDRTAQGDFFICDILDAAPKGDMASMEHPIFSLATKPDTRIRRYENGRAFVEVVPSVLGLATVHDRDVLIYCISQCMAALNEGRKVSRTVRLKAHELLASTNRGTDGRGYEQLKASLERLAGTRIQTNVTTGDVEVLDGFGLIDRYRIVRETRDGRMQDLEIQLSDWVFNAIEAKEVLTLHRNYFRLRKPIERRLYELARKHCGEQPQWMIGLEKLKTKCGSASTLKEFRRLVGAIIEDDEQHKHLPDYSVRWRDSDTVVFENRRVRLNENAGRTRLHLQPETFEKARMVARGFDVYVIEGEWREWMADKDTPDRPDAAFIGFVKSWAKKRKAA